LENTSYKLSWKKKWKGRDKRPKRDTTCTSSRKGPLSAGEKGIVLSENTLGGTKTKRARVKEKKVNYLLSTKEKSS